MKITLGNALSAFVLYMGCWVYRYIRDELRKERLRKKFNYRSCACHGRKSFGMVYVTYRWATSGNSRKLAAIRVHCAGCNAVLKEDAI